MCWNSFCRTERVSSGCLCGGSKARPSSTPMRLWKRRQQLGEQSSQTCRGSPCAATTKSTWCHAGGWLRPGMRASKYVGRRVKRSRRLEGQCWIGL
eukprot:4144427-Lingulodinium_polyedra.AAC.1